ncbi:MAG: hypothetical protein HQK50_08210 [Oligoflexia bacterium]|nr:hypothetical protein [Oligoflexia bacterium]MBF0365541.1 hypothetical protein [Oligoflexia bacterium]
MTLQLKSMFLRGILFLGFMFALFQWIYSAYAFPENIRHGYNNCTSCHYSPSGGGLITPYGRELSREISTWGNEGEEVQPLYGAIKLPAWFDYGGDLRAVQIYRNNIFLEEAKFIPMQFDLEAMVTYHRKYSLLATLGPVHKVGKGKKEFEINSRRHYFLIHFSDLLTLRTGKFMPAFGINVPDHIISTKRGLNLDEGSETYNAELSYLSSGIGLYLTAIFGWSDREKIDRKHTKGASFNVSYSFLQTFKVGGNYLHQYRTRWKRDLFGTYAVLGFTKHLYLLSELDLQRSTITPQVSGPKISQTGFFVYKKIGWEVVRGLHLFWAYDSAKTDLKIKETRGYSTGPGIIWYPRPHYEVAVSWLKQKNSIADKDFSDYLWIMFHAYL